MSTLIPYRHNNHLSRPDAMSFMDDFFRPFFGMDNFTSTFSVDVKDEGDKFVLEADMPGMKRENVHVDVEDGVLTISTQIDEKDERTEKGKYIYRERRYGRSSRSFNLDGIEENGITAEFKDGVLKLTLPKEKAQQKLSGRTIEIQ